jgi:hypothetical protein
VTTRTGRSVLVSVEVVLSLELELALILPPLTVVRSVKGRVLRVGSVIHNSVLD